MSSMRTSEKAIIPGTNTGELLSKYLLLKPESLVWNTFRTERLGRQCLIDRISFLR